MFGFVVGLVVGIPILSSDITWVVSSPDYYVDTGKYAEIKGSEDAADIPGF